MKSGYFISALVMLLAAVLMLSACQVPQTSANSPTGTQGANSGAGSQGSVVGQGENSGASAAEEQEASPPSGEPQASGSDSNTGSGTSTTPPAEAKLGGLSLTGNVEGGEVYLNDELKGKLPLDISLPIGIYKMWVKKEGYKDYFEQFRVDEGATLKLQVYLVEANEGFGNVSVRSTPDKAQIFIDGELGGTTNVVVIGIKPGTHTAVFKKSGYMDYTTEFSIEAGQKISIEATLQKEEPTMLEIEASVEAGLTSANYELWDEKMQVKVKSGVTPASFEGLKAAKYNVKVTKPGYAAYTSVIELVPGEEVVVSPILVKS